MGLDLVDQTWGENFEYTVSESFEQLLIYGLKLERKMDMHDHGHGIIGRGANHFTLNEEPIVFWEFDAKNGKLTIINDRIAFKNFKPVDITQGL